MGFQTGLGHSAGLTLGIDGVTETTDGGSSCQACLGAPGPSRAEDIMPGGLDSSLVEARPALRHLHYGGAKSRFVSIAV